MRFFLTNLLWYLLAMLCSQSLIAEPIYSNHLQILTFDSKQLLQLQERLPNVIIDHVSSKGYEVYGDESLIPVLKGLNIPFVHIREEHEKNSIDQYPSPEQINEKLENLQRKFPSLMTLIEIGKSVEKRPLLFAKLSSNQGATNLPEFKYVANMHGDEIAGRDVLMMFIEDLLSSYGKDPQVTKLMDTIHIYIMPSLNPDGAANQRRFNANGYDLNRAFPRRDGKVPVGYNQPEVQAMLAFQKQHDFKLSANFHGGASVINYPWDDAAEDVPMKGYVEEISLNYARNVDYMWNSSEFKNGITNGYQWYSFMGGMQDWSYRVHDDLQVTIELTDQKWPRYNSLPTVYAKNRQSLLEYVAEVVKF